MPRMVLEIRGGVLVGAYGSDATTQITVVDWDNFDPADSRSLVGHVECVPLRMIPAETADIISRSTQTAANDLGLC